MSYSALLAVELIGLSVAKGDISCLFVYPAKNGLRPNSTLILYAPARTIRTSRVCHSTCDRPPLHVAGAGNDQHCAPIHTYTHTLVCTLSFLLDSPIWIMVGIGIFTHIQSYAYYQVAKYSFPQRTITERPFNHVSLFLLLLLPHRGFPLSLPLFCNTCIIWGVPLKLTLH